MQGSTTNVGFVYENPSFEKKLLETILQTLCAVKICFISSEKEYGIEFDITNFMKNLFAQEQGERERILQHGISITSKMNDATFDVLISKESEGEKKCILIWFQDRFFLNSEESEKEYAKLLEDYEQFIQAIVKSVISKNQILYAFCDNDAGLSAGSLKDILKKRLYSMLFYTSNKQLNVVRSNWAVDGFTKR